MSWTPEQLTKHPKFKSLVGVNKKLQHSSSVNIEPLNKSTVPAIITPAPAPNPPAPDKNSVRFTVPGKPIGKPRMTQRDKWQKRPCVLAYREHCDHIREVTPPLLATVDCYALDIYAHIEVPPSWSDKKKARFIGQPCRSKPDADNIIKSVADAMFEDDSGIWDERCRKYWCANGAEHIEIIVHYTL
jgi:Holliday junction resolvase RusA-like endonuclease